MSTEILGAFWIYIAFTILVQIFITFSYDTSIYIHFHEYKNDRAILAPFISSVFIYILISGSVVIALLSLTGNFIFNLVFNESQISFYPYGLICIFTALFQASFKIHTSLLQTQQRPDLYFRSNLLNFSLIAGCTILGLQLYPNSLLGPIGGRFLAALVSGVWSFGSVFTEFGFHFKRKLLRDVYSFNFYSFIYQLQQWVVNYFDRIVISLFLPLNQVGIYGFAMSCLLVVEFVVNGLYSSFAPKIISLIADQKEKKSTLEINRYFNGLTVVAMLLVTMCILIFPVLINEFISKPEYKLSIEYIPYVGIIYLFKSMRLYFGIPYGILKYTKPLPVIYLIVAATKIGAMFILIKHLGIYGVIVSSLLSYWMEVFLLYLWGSNRFQYTFNIFKMLLAPIALAILIVSVEFLIGSQYGLLLHIFYFSTCITLIMWAYRNEIRLISPVKIILKK